MKNLVMSVFALTMVSATGTSLAWWNGDNDYGPWGGGDWNPYDEWDPRYWKEEMENEWDNDDDHYRRGYYGGPYGGYGGPYGGYGAPYGGGYAPYGGYGYGAPAPYGGGYGPSRGYAPGQAAPAAPAPQYDSPQYGSPQYGY